MRYVLAIVALFLMTFPALADCGCSGSGNCVCGVTCACEDVTSADAPAMVAATPITDDLLACPDYPNIAYSRSQKAWVVHVTAKAPAPVAATYPVTVPSSFSCSSGQCGAGGCASGSCGRGRIFGRRR